MYKDIFVFREGEGGGSEWVEGANICDDKNMQFPDIFFKHAIFLNHPSWKLNNMLWTLLQKLAF